MPAGIETTRRGALVSAVALATGSALALSGCAKGKEGGEEDVSATEDLMREHGVLRRILVVYRETAPALRSSPGAIDAGALAAAADLFRNFGETYHEAMLEEQHIFPAVRKAGGEAAGLVDTLLAQHQRGREITAFVRAKCGAGKVGTGDAEPLARALESFVRMYEAHTAYEDTIVFQAWRKSLSKKQLDEAGDLFEDIERRQFKGDGFDMAVDEITRIEQRLGLHGLARFTAAPAPAASAG
jgi:hemerythrin-like domain-containing protein